MFSPTVMESKSAPCWNTIPMARRISRSLSGVARVMSSSFTRMLPESGCQSPITKRKIVLLPEPDGPRMTRVCPRETRKETLTRMT